MPSVRPLFLVLLLGVLLSGCSVNTGNSRVLEFISVSDGNVLVRTPGGSNATITAIGDLSIDGKPVALVPTQRALLRQYFFQALAVRSRGAAAGAAGVALARKAVGTVVSGIASGNPDSIGPTIANDAIQVGSQAIQGCGGIDNLRNTQDALVRAVPAFQPYALIDARQAAQCRAEQ